MNKGQKSISEYIIDKFEEYKVEHYGKDSELKENETRENIVKQPYRFVVHKDFMREVGSSYMNYKVQNLEFGGPYKREKDHLGFMEEEIDAKGFKDTFILQSNHTVNLSNVDINNYEKFNLKKYYLKFILSPTIFDSYAKSQDYGDIYDRDSKSFNVTPKQKDEIIKPNIFMIFNRSPTKTEEKDVSKYMKYKKDDEIIKKMNEDFDNVRQGKFAQFYDARELTKSYFHTKNTNLMNIIFNNNVDIIENADYHKAKIYSKDHKQDERLPTITFTQLEMEYTIIETFGSIVKRLEILIDAKNKAVQESEYNKIKRIEGKTREILENYKQFIYAITQLVILMQTKIGYIYDIFSLPIWYVELQMYLIRLLCLLKYDETNPITKAQFREVEEYTTNRLDKIFDELFTKEHGLSQKKLRKDDTMASLLNYVMEVENDQKKEKLFEYFSTLLILSYDISKTFDDKFLYTSKSDDPDKRLEALYKKFGELTQMLIDPESYTDKTKTDYFKEVGRGFSEIISSVKSIASSVGSWFAGLFGRDNS
jgi:hypothetical protein